MLKRKRVKKIMDVKLTREARNKGTVAFTKFCNDKKGHENHLFCFFEGEDNKYYGSRIEKYTEYPSTMIVNYNCGGRKEVERAKRLISSKSEYNEINKLFFIDSDYVPNTEISSDMYQTPCYSIENFYSSVDCFGKILYTEFGINYIDDDYKKCINDYIQRQSEFHTITEYLNLWLCYQRYEEENQHKKAIELTDYKIAKLFSEISIESVIPKYSIDAIKLKEQFPKAYEINEDKIKAISEKWSSTPKNLIYRGKFEMEFLRKVLESLILANKKTTYFSQTYNCVSLNPGNNMLSTFSLYADTPECLILFLKKHKYNKAN